MNNVILKIFQDIVNLALNILVKSKIMILKIFQDIINLAINILKKSKIMIIFNQGVRYISLEKDENFFLPLFSSYSIVLSIVMNQLRLFNHP